jgi:hypothetical protein
MTAQKVVICVGAKRQGTPVEGMRHLFLLDAVVSVSSIVVVATLIVASRTIRRCAAEH